MLERRGAPEQIAVLGINVKHLRDGTLAADLSPEPFGLVSRLRQALTEEAVVSEGNVFSYPVASAVKAFGTNLSAAIPILIDGILSSNDLVRMNASLGIGYLSGGAHVTVPRLLELAQASSQSREVRRTALNALTYIAQSDPAALQSIVPDLIPILDDADISLLEATAQTLGAIGPYSREAASALARLLEYSVSPEEAAQHLRIENVDGEVEDMIVQKRNPGLTRNIRTSAAEALERMGTEAAFAVPVFERLLNDSDIEVRRAAAIALWRIAGRTDGVMVIAESLSIADISALDRALRALGEMGPAAGPAKLAVERLARFSNPEIRDPAQAALSKIAPQVGGGEKPTSHP